LRVLDALDGGVDGFRGAAGLASLLRVPQVESGGAAAEPDDDDLLGRARGRVLRKQELGHRGAEDFRLPRHGESEETAQGTAEQIAAGHPETPGPFAILAVVRHNL